MFGVKCMRWKPITISVLCASWFPAVLIGVDWNWTYERATMPFFPLSVALAIAVCHGATIVIPFAAIYFCLRLDRSSTENYRGPFLSIAWVLTTLVGITALALLWSQFTIGRGHVM